MARKQVKASSRPLLRRWGVAWAVDWCEVESETVTENLDLLPTKVPITELCSLKAVFVHYFLELGRIFASECANVLVYEKIVEDPQLNRRVGGWWGFCEMELNM